MQHIHIYLSIFSVTTIENILHWSNVVLRNNIVKQYIMYCLNIAFVMIPIPYYTIHYCTVHIYSMPMFSRVYAILSFLKIYICKHLMKNIDTLYLQ